MHIANKILTFAFVFNFLRCIVVESDIIPLTSAVIPSTDDIVYRDGDVIQNPLVVARNFWSAARFRWPKGKIPYTISTAYTESEKQIIMAAIGEWQNKTCIRFVIKGATDVDYVEITPNDGTSSYCYSYVGRQGGRQRMKMYGECLRHAAMVHELGHVIGFNHEHQRPDRDDFVNILLKNINSTYHHAFVKYPYAQVDNLGTPYDYSSVMQYPFYSFTAKFDRTKPAITLKDGSIEKIKTEAAKLSAVDILKAQKYYNNCK